MNPFVTVIIPCRNEEGFIDRCLASLLAGDFPKDRLEVFVVDGVSRDRTREIVRERMRVEPAISLIDNPQGTAPAALNLGIRRAKGDVIVRLDAHCIYPREYISGLLRWMNETGADNVGGVWRTLPAADTAKARAIAIALAHPFGVGNSYFRIGAREPRWVDTVPFGCYRRDVFDRIGLFDEDLVRNQDDEFNARLVRHGGRILLVPEIVCDYFARESLRKLWRMSYQYGYFKPLVARKIGTVMTVRQLVPALFVAAVGGGAPIAAAISALRVPYLTAIALYLAANIGCAVVAGRKYGIATVAWLATSFAALHVSYGMGFLKGVLDFLVRNRRSDARLQAMAPTR